jgi:hypothetical protein
MPQNNEMHLTRSAMARLPRPSQVISVFDGPGDVLGVRVLSLLRVQDRIAYAQQR